MNAAFLKTTLADALQPIVGLSNISTACQRLWAYAYLRAHVPGLHPSCVVLNTPELHGTHRLNIGRNLYIFRDVYFETQEHGEIHIGDDVVISRGVHLVAFARIDIGNGSMIGEYTSLRDANHRIGYNIAPRHSGHDAAPIRIGNNVWIGRGATVLPGISIGDGAVVGANAVVTHNVPAHTIVAGVPARQLTKLNAVQERCA